MTTKEVAALFGVGLSIAARWAKANGVERVMSVNGIMAYEWTEADIERFKNRAKAGWQKGRPRKKTD